jgi:hypothetical protein
MPRYLKGVNIFKVRCLVGVLIASDMRLPVRCHCKTIVPACNNSHVANNAHVACGSIAAEPVKPDGAVCPLLIRLRRHFCSGVNEGPGGDITPVRLPSEDAHER